MSPPPAPSPLNASPHILAILDRLHAESLAQEAALDSAHVADLRNAKRDGSISAATAFDTLMRDKFIALEQDKCLLVHHLLRATGARFVVEAGTSFGVSTVYLALGVGANCAAAGPGAQGKVIATEFEPSKAARARAMWAECGDDVQRWIELREGDLRETLKADLPSVVDFLLLDIWSPLALPTLRLVEPALRAGAVVLVDNVVVNPAGGYDDLLKYLRAEESGYASLTLPYSGGLEMCIFLGKSQ